MAETQEAILKVSLKEYKQQIDDLRASLLSLNETDEEYAKIANEVKERQTKLNSVMSVGKKNADALDGSYNALVNQMAKLKKAWRETANELERKNLGQQILQINNQLKALDASTGNYQRSVGDYANAFEEAMKKSLGGLSGMGGELGNTLGMLGRLIPLIKKTTQAATTGLHGIKAAIISTGIGALVVAVATLLANWNSIADAIFGVNEEIEKENKLTQAVLDKNKQIEQKVKDETKLMNARGKSQKEILQYQQKEYQQIIANNQARILELKTTYKQIEAQGWLLNLLTGGRRQMKDINEQIKTLTDEIDRYKGILHDISVDIQVEDEKAKNGSGGGKREVLSKSILERLKDYGKDELQILKETYDKEFDLLKQDLKRRTITQQQFYDNAKKLGDEYKKSVIEIYQQIIDNADVVRDEMQKYGNPVAFEAEELVKGYDMRNEILEKARDTELEIYGKTKEDIERINKKYNDLELLNYQKLQEDKQKIVERENEKALAKDTANAKRNMDASIKSENNRYDLYSATATSFNLEEELEHIQTLYNAQEEYFNFVIQKNQEILEAENITDEERELAQQRLADAQMSLEEAKTKKTISEINARNKANQKSNKFTVQDAQKTAQALGSILGTVNQAYEDNLRQKVENGEISQEEAEKEWNRTKGLQYAETVVNTAAAAMGAYNSLASIPYVGPVLGAAAAAAAVAAGAVQIQTIKNAKFDSSGSAGGEGATPLVIPPIATYAPTESTVDTGQSDIDKLSNALENTTLYVSVTDVDNAQAKQRRRVNETTW